ncbi:MAG: hypothetical protein H0X27_10760 [Caulobacteraceae bacterium]|nr:hypothetical protein [Caulobacteraceae bacterium]
MTSSFWTGGNGDWGEGAHWSDGVPDAPDADATIGAAGTYTVTLGAGESFTARDVGLSAAAATLEVRGALDLSGTLSLDSGTFDLASGGVIHGGTIVTGAATMLFDHGVLDDVQVVGPLDLSSAFSWLTVTHGLKVTSPSGGRGLITLDGDFSVLDFQGSQSFDHARISLGGAPGFNGGFILNTGTLTLGRHVTVVSSIDRARATIGGATVINDGVILSRAHFGFFAIDPKAFTNNGSIIAGGRQSVLVADGKSFINGLTGTIEVKATDRVIVGGEKSTFDNQGSIVIDEGGQLTLGGTYSLASLGSIQNDGVLNLGGLLMNQGSTLELGVGALAGKLVLGGTIQGGILVLGQDKDVTWAGTLDGVTVRGTLDLSRQQFATVFAQNGLTLTGADGQGPGRVLLTGPNSSLFFFGSQTFDNATVRMGHAPGDGVFADIIRLRVPIRTAATLTLGAGLRIVSNVAGAQARIDQEANRRIDGTIINDGLIRAAAAGGRFDIAPDHFINNGRIQVRNTDHLVIGLFGDFTNNGRLRAAAGSSVLFNAGGFSSFTNAGKIVIGQGATLDVTGVYTPASLGDVRVRGTFILDGLIDNTGQTITIGRGPIFGATTVLGPNGHIEGGTLALGRGPISWNNGDLSNVRVEGRMDLGAADARVFFLGGVSLAGRNGSGRGAIDLTGAGAILDFIDSQSLDNTTITVGHAGSTNAIELFTVRVEPHTLTFGSGMRIVATVAGSTVTLGDSFPSPDTIVNEGLIWAGANGGAFTIDVSIFTNTGRIRVDGGDTVTIRGNLNGGGVIDLAGGATLELGDVSSNQTIVFRDDAGALKLDSTLGFFAAVEGFQSGDAIDLIHIEATSLTLDGQDRLIVKDHATVVATIQLVGAYAEGDFAFAGDGAGGTIITTSATPSSIGRPPVQAMAQAMAGLSPHSDGMAAFAVAHEPAPHAWLPSLVHASGAAFQ